MKFCEASAFFLAYSLVDLIWAYLSSFDSSLWPLSPEDFYNTKRLLLFFNKIAFTYRWENSWRRQDLIKMLELLPGLVLVWVSHSLVIDLADIGESVNDESSQEDCVRHFVVFYAHTSQGSQGLKFRNLDEAVNIVVLEQELLQFLESLKLANVIRGDDVVESNVLEADLLNGFLELYVVEDF